jgi:hypothetical protein
VQLRTICNMEILNILAGKFTTCHKIHDSHGLLAWSKKIIYACTTTPACCLLVAKGNYFTSKTQATCVWGTMNVGIFGAIK